MLGINSAILLHLYGYDAKNINNISLKFIMLTDNNQIFRNWFVIIQRHLTKVSVQIIQCIIFEHNELSLTLSTLLGIHFGGIIQTRITKLYLFNFHFGERCLNYNELLSFMYYCLFSNNNYHFFSLHLK